MTRPTDPTTLSTAPELELDQWLATIHPAGWVYQAWRRPLNWRRLAQAAAATATAVAMALTASAAGLSPVWATGTVLGLLAALWHRYLAQPISGIEAHRPLPTATAPTTAKEPAMPTTRQHRPTRSDHRTTPELHQAALDYAARGWHVFPLRPGTKKPATPNHPAHLCDHSDPRCTNGHTGWEQRATTDPDRITRAWTHRPYGIGIACGPSHLLVIDLDAPKTPGHRSGTHHLAHLEHELGHQLPPTYTVATPSGGQHRYYRTPTGSALTNTASRVAPYIDTRAAGGYVVAPPTRTTDGHYHLLADVPLPELPTWFAQLLTDPTPPPSRPAATSVRTARTQLAATDPVACYVAAAIDGELHRLTTAGPGTRNNTLFTVAVALGQLVGADLLDRPTAHQTLLQASSGHVNAGAYSNTQALQTIASGLHRGQQQPRRLPANLTAEPVHP